jgi:hypothetical protein
MRALFVCALLLSISGSILFVSGQEQQQREKGKAQASDAKATNDQIEVKEDRFSGATTVKMKPQVVLEQPDHQLTIEIETKLGEKKSYETQKDEIFGNVKLVSQSKAPVKFGDEELHFLIDGKPLDLGKTRGSVDAYAERYNRLKPGFKISQSFTLVIDRPDLERFSKANRLEMRLGTIEITLGQSVVSLLREYATQVLSQHKNSKEKKP